MDFIMSCVLEFKGILIPFLEFKSVQSIAMKHLTNCFTALGGKVSFITQLGLEKRTTPISWRQMFEKINCKISGSFLKL
jgi:hypothetical protein